MGEDYDMPASCATYYVAGSFLLPLSPCPQTNNTVVFYPCSLVFLACMCVCIIQDAVGTGEHSSYVN